MSEMSFKDTLLIQTFHALLEQDYILDVFYSIYDDTKNFSRGVVVVERDGLSHEFVFFPENITDHLAGADISATAGLSSPLINNGIIYFPFSQSAIDFKNKSLNLLFPKRGFELIESDLTRLPRFINFLTSAPDYTLSEELRWIISSYIKNHKYNVFKPLERKPGRFYRQLELLFFSGHAVKNLILLQELGLFEELFGYVRTLSAKDKELTLYLVQHVCEESDRDATLWPSLLFYAVHWHDIKKSIRDETIPYDLEYISNISTPRIQFYHFDKDTMSIQANKDKNGRCVLNESIHTSNLEFILACEKEYENQIYNIQTSDLSENSDTDISYKSIDGPTTNESDLSCEVESPIIIKKEVHDKVIQKMANETITELVHTESVEIISQVLNEITQEKNLAEMTHEVFEETLNLMIHELALETRSEVLNELIKEKAEDTIIDASLDEITEKAMNKTLDDAINSVHLAIQQEKLEATAEYWFLRGQNLAKENTSEEHEQAILIVECYEKALSIDPHHILTHQACIDLYIKKGTNLTLKKKIKVIHEKILQHCNQLVAIPQEIYQAQCNTDANRPEYADFIYSVICQRANIYSTLGKQTEAENDWLKAREYYISKERYAEALTCYKKILDTNPHHLAILKEYITISLELGAEIQKEALNYCISIIDYEPLERKHDALRYWAYCQQGNIYSNLNEDKKARASYKSATKINPNLPEAYYKLGDLVKRYAASSSNQTKKNELYNEASIFYNEAIKHNPKCSEAHWGLGKIAEVFGQINSAEESYRKSLGIQIEKSPEVIIPVIPKAENTTEIHKRNIKIPDYKSHYQQGKAYLSQSKYPEAIREFDVILTAYEQSENIDLLEITMRSYIHTGKAVHELTHAKKNDTDIVHAKNDYKNAALLISRLGEKFQYKLIPVYLGLGEIEQAQDNLVDALQYYQDTLILIHENSVHSDKRKYRDKLIEWSKIAQKKIAEIKDKENSVDDKTVVDSEHWFRLAQENHSKCIYDHALAFYKKTLEFNSEHILAHRHLIDLYILLNQPEKALIHASFLIELNQSKSDQYDYYHAIYQRARVYLMTSQNDNARNDLNSVIALTTPKKSKKQSKKNNETPEDPKWSNLLAHVYFSMGEWTAIQLRAERGKLKVPEASISVHNASEQKTTQNDMEDVLQRIIDLENQEKKYYEKSLAYIPLSQAYAALGNIENARAYTCLMQIEHYRIQTKLLMTEGLISKNDPKALSELKKAQENHAKAAKYLRNAKAQYQLALEHNSQSPEAHVGLGDIAELSATPDKKEIKENYLLALKYYPNFFDVYLKLAKIEKELKNTDMAIHYYQRYLDGNTPTLSPEELFLHFYELAESINDEKIPSYVAGKLNKENEEPFIINEDDKRIILLSKEVYLRAIQHSPKLNAAHFKLAAIAFFLENYDETIERTLSFVNEDFGTIYCSKKELYYILGECYKHKDDYTNAKKYYSKVLEPVEGEYDHSPLFDLNKWRTKAQEQINYITSYMQPKKELIAQIAELADMKQHDISVPHNDNESWKEEGQKLKQLGLYENAIALYNNFIESNPHNLDLRFQRFEAYIQTHEYDPGLNELSFFMGIDETSYHRDYSCSSIEKPPFNNYQYYTLYVKNISAEFSLSKAIFQETFEETDVIEKFDAIIQAAANSGSHYFSELAAYAYVGKGQFFYAHAQLLKTISESVRNLEEKRDKSHDTSEFLQEISISYHNDDEKVKHQIALLETQALENYEHAILLYPLFIAHYELGCLLKTQGENAILQGNADAKKGTFDKKEIEAFRQGKKHIQSAEIHYWKAIKINTDSDEAYFSLGHIEEIKCNNEAAKKHYLMSVTISPFYLDAYMKLGKIEEALGNNESALQYYRQYSTLSIDMFTKQLKDYQSAETQKLIYEFIYELAESMNSEKTTKEVYELIFNTSTSRLIDPKKASLIILKETYEQAISFLPMHQYTTAHIRLAEIDFILKDYSSVIARIQSMEKGDFTEVKCTQREIFGLLAKCYEMSGNYEHNISAQKYYEKAKHKLSYKDENPDNMSNLVTLINWATESHKNVSRIIIAENIRRAKAAKMIELTETEITNREVIKQSQSILNANLSSDTLSPIQEANAIQDQISKLRKILKQEKINLSDDRLSVKLREISDLEIQAQDIYENAKPQAEEL